MGDICTYEYTAIEYVFAICGILFIYFLLGAIGKYWGYSVCLKTKIMRI